MPHSDLRGMLSICEIFGWEEAFGIVQRKVIQLKATLSLKHTDRGPLLKGSNSMLILPCICLRKLWFFSGALLAFSCFKWTFQIILVFCFPFLKAVKVETEVFYCKQFFCFVRWTETNLNLKKERAFKSTCETHQKNHNRKSSYSDAVLFKKLFYF